MRDVATCIYGYSTTISARVYQTEAETRGTDESSDALPCSWQPSDRAPDLRRNITQYSDLTSISTPHTIHCRNNNTASFYGTAGLS